jgi:hypothetical protein
MGKNRDKERVLADILVNTESIIGQSETTSIWELVRKIVGR